MSRAVPQRLFVYGSLQPDGPNEHVLSRLTGSWRAASVRGRLVQDGWGSALGFPGLVLDDSAAAVPGSLLSSEELASKWAELDAFEGEEYERVTAEVKLDSGESVVAQLYVLRRG